MIQNFLTVIPVHTGQISRYILRFIACMIGKRLRKGLFPRFCTGIVMHPGHQYRNCGGKNLGHLILPCAGGLCYCLKGVAAQ